MKRWVWLSLLLGCARPGPVAVKPDAAKSAPEDVRARAERLFNETVERHGGYVALASNVNDQRSNIRRLQLGLQVFQAALRCPPTADEAGLEAALRALAAKLGLPLLSLQVKARARGDAKLPEKVPDGTPLRLRPDDIRGVVDVDLVLRAAPTPELLAKVGRETIELRRLVLWERAAPATVDGAPALALRGEAYWYFPDVRVPVVDHRPPAFDDALRRAGLPATVADPAAREHLEKVRAMYAQMAQRLSDYKQVLELNREAALLRARLAYLQNRRQRQDVFGRSDASPN